MAAGPIRRALRVLELVGILLYELVKSSIAVAKLAFSRDTRTTSSIVAVPIYLRTDAGIEALANCVTLTPGTCSLHVSDDKKTLYVHALEGQAPDDVVESIERVFERRIREIEG